MAVTARIAGSEAGGPANGGMDWQIEYDDTTRNVTAACVGSGRCRVQVQVTAAVSRIVGFEGPGRTVPDADFHVAADQNTQDVTAAAQTTIASGVNPNQVSRIVGKPGNGALGGLPYESSWSRS